MKIELLAIIFCVIIVVLIATYICGNRESGCDGKRNYDGYINEHHEI